MRCLILLLAYACCCSTASWITTSSCIRCMYSRHCMQSGTMSDKSNIHAALANLHMHQNSHQAEINMTFPPSQCVAGHTLGAAQYNCSPQLLATEQLHWRRGLNAFVNGISVAVAEGGQSINHSFPLTSRFCQPVWGSELATVWSQMHLGLLKWMRFLVLFSALSLFGVSAWVTAQVQRCPA